MHACLVWELPPDLPVRSRVLGREANLYFECGNSRPTPTHLEPPRPPPPPPTPHPPPYHHRTPPPPPTTTHNHHPSPLNLANQDKIVSASDQSHSVQSHGPEWGHQQNEQSWRRLEDKSPSFGTVLRGLSGCICFFHCGIKTKKHLDWVISRWSPLYPLNLELTRPNSLVDCKMATDLMKINVKDADSYWNQMVTYGCVPNW